MPNVYIHIYTIISNIKKGKGYEQMIHTKNTNEKNVRKADQPF